MKILTYGIFFIFAFVSFFGVHAQNPKPATPPTVIEKSKIEKEYQDLKTNFLLFSEKLKAEKNKLAAKAKIKKEKSKIEYDRQIAKLEKEKEELDKKFDELKNQTSEKWEAAKKDLEKRVNNFKNEVDKLK